MQSFQKIMLVLLIVAFPLASWYYLNSGLNFRKKALRELTPKGVWHHASPLDSMTLKGYTSVIFMGEGMQEAMTTIYDQYSSSNTFQIVQISKDTLTDVIWNNEVMSPTEITSIFKDNKCVFLTDTSSHLRYVYYNDKLDYGQLVEHLSIVLPREKDPDIKMISRNDGE